MANLGEEFWHLGEFVALDYWPATTFVGFGDLLRGMSGAAALGRERSRSASEAAVAAQAERLEAEQAAIIQTP